MATPGDVAGADGGAERGHEGLERETAGRRAPVCAGRGPCVRTAVGEAHDLHEASRKVRKMPVPKSSAIVHGPKIASAAQKIALLIVPA